MIQKSGQDVFISACMMVKNEEEMLPRCLESIKSLVDEIIIVDTGSTDKTVDIAQSYGASVYFHPWQNDFSLHRNQSISYAQGEWIFIIDADEELKFNNASTEVIREWLRTMPSDSNAAAIPLRDIQQGQVVMKFNTARFFRKGKVKYEGSVHNQPQIHGVGYLCPHMFINHYGYDLSSEKMAKKEERTKGLLLKRIKDNPKDYMAYFYLCQICATRGHREECVQYGEEYVKHKEELIIEDNFNPSVYYTVVMNFLKLNNIEKAEEWLRMGLKDIPNDLDLNYALFHMGIENRDRDRILIGARRYMRAFDDLQKNAGINQGRFTYTFNADALSHVAYNAALINLTDGYNLIKVLEQTLPKASSENRTAILNNLKKAMEPYGIEVEITDDLKSDKFSSVPVTAPDSGLLNQIMEGM